MRRARGTSGSTGSPCRPSAVLTQRFEPSRDRNRPDPSVTPSSRRAIENSEARRTPPRSRSRSAGGSSVAREAEAQEELVGASGRARQAGDGRGRLREVPLVARRQVQPAGLRQVEGGQTATGRRPRAKPRRRRRPCRGTPAHLCARLEAAPRGSPPSAASAGAGRTPPLRGPSGRGPAVARAPRRRAAPRSAARRIDGNQVRHGPPENTFSTFSVTPPHVETKSASANCPPEASTRPRVPSTAAVESGSSTDAPPYAWHLGPGQSRSPPPRTAPDGRKRRSAPRRPAPSAPRSRRSASAPSRRARRP